MKLKLIMLSVFLIIASFSTSFAVGENIIGSSNADDFSKVGAAGSQFMKIGAGARANGMAGAYTSIANDLSGLYYNPAAVAQLKGIEANFNYTSWFAGFTHNYGAVGFLINENFRGAVSFTSFSSNDIEITTMNNPEGTGSYYSVSDMAVGLSFGGNLTEQFSFGITGKMIRNAFSTLSATALTFDVGTIYKTGIEGINLGFAIHNLGTEQKYEGQNLEVIYQELQGISRAPQDAQLLAYPFQAPIIFRAGVSKSFDIDEENRLLVAGDFITQSDSPENVAFGLEYDWSKIFYARAGYLVGHDQQGFSGGVGISYLTGGFDGKFDYSISPTANIGYINRLSIAIGVK